MSIRNRPYVGEWSMNRTLVRHTPDTVVFINGYQEFASCPGCSQPIDINKYITSVSVDGSTEAAASANFSVVIPQHEIEKFRINGNNLLQPTLEVTVFMRGYFPMLNFGGFGQDVEGSEDFDPNEVPVYPYYQVFRGVVTQVSHEFSGGFYSASVQCSNLLHFWQYLHLSVNGAVFGKRPAGSMVEPRLDGHRFTGMNPYAIIYTLVKVAFGAAYGVDFQYSKTSNTAATGDTSNKSLFAHAAEWWERRWQENSGALRMYGIDGRMFNAEQQAYLGFWKDASAANRNTGTKGYTAAVKHLYNAMNGQNKYNPGAATKIQVALRKNAYDPVSTQASIVAGEDGSDVAIIDDVVRMQAFVFDISKLGNVNFFETEYMTKIEIAEAVKTITGFEFYQDVDGDLVFKPPMYNLDTRDDPVYIIKDRDLISISEQEGEPECTFIKGTGSHFANVSGHGVDGWMGVGAVFIDYALVARFGYRDETFETNYLSNRHAIYVSAVNRLDVANASVQSASITIPIRPELRPGYPVYIESQDCFFYATSISHSFQSGSQCTTTINGVAKRAKWFPPIDPSTSGTFPTMKDVRLDAPGEFPQLPLYAYPKYIEGHEDVDAGPPRIVGFPNVVLALDASKVNYATINADTGLLQPDDFVLFALATGFLQRVPSSENLLLSDGTDQGREMSTSEVKAQYSGVAEAIQQGDIPSEASDTFSRFLGFIQQQITVDVDKAQDLVNYLSLVTSLKASFSPGTSLTGKYRYYSSSHPDPVHQAPTNLKIRPGEVPVAEPSEGVSGTTTMFLQDNLNKGVSTVSGTPTRGIKVKSLTSKPSGDVTPEDKVVLTGDIRFVTMAAHQQYRNIRVSRVSTTLTSEGNFRFNQDNTVAAFAFLLMRRADPDIAQGVPERFEAEYSRLYGDIEQFAKECEVKSEVYNPSDNPTDLEAFKDRFDLGNGSFATAADVSPQSPDEAAMGGFASVAAALLWGALSAIVESVIEDRDLTDRDTYLEFMGIRAKFISNYTDSAVSVPGEEYTNVYLPTDEIEENSVEHFTPVFPVSDSQGFEVYGNLPYGRGLNITKYSELLQSTKSAEGSGVEAAESSDTRVGTLGVNSSDMEAVENLYFALKVKDAGLLPDDTNIGQLLQSEAFTDSGRAALAAYYNVPQASDITEGVIEAVRNQSESQGVFIRNRPVTSFFRGQSVTSEVASVNLANLTLGEGQGCVCKGANQEFFLMAFSEQYVDLYGVENAVEGFQSETVYTSGENWEYTKEALAGELPDLRTDNVAQAIKDGFSGVPSKLYEDEAANLTRGLAELAGDAQGENNNAFQQSVEDLKKRNAERQGLVYDPETDTFTEPPDEEGA